MKALISWKTWAVLGARMLASLWLCRALLTVLSFVNNLKPFHVQLRDFKGGDFLADGKYIIIHDGEQHHFWALPVREGLFVQMDGVHRSFLASFSVTNMLQDPNFTFYRFRPCTCTSILIQDCQGGSGGVCKRPAASHSRQTYTCPTVPIILDCVKGGWNLHYFFGCVRIVMECPGGRIETLTNVCLRFLGFSRIRRMEIKPQCTQKTKQSRDPSARKRR